jgi:hypothetical protein
MASRLAHLKGADEAAVWEAIPAIFPDVVGVPCDKANPYHCALAGAVVRTVRYEEMGRSRFLPHAAVNVRGTVPGW